MKEKRFFVPGLAHASYLIGSAGEAAVVDPKRDVDDYIHEAEAAGLKIVAILNSHPHADFVSGFIELAQKTGAKIYSSHLAPVTYDHIPSKDGDKIRVGDLDVEIWETPGHSPDSLSFIVHEMGEPVSIYTGDLLFVGDVGRPDLRDADEDPSDLANKLYDSLFNKVLTLPDNVKIFPAHGEGSLCGRAISSSPFSLIGQEKQANWAAQITDRKEFVKEMTSNLPDRPSYFSFDVEINLKGAPLMASLPKLETVSERDLEKLQSEGAFVIDTRSPLLFGSGHFPGSINIGLGSPMFSTWVGFLIPPGKPLALVVDSAESVSNAQLELARIGYDSVIGFILADEINRLKQTSQLSVCDLKSSIESNTAPYLLDVRTAGEWRSNHIDEAHHIPLPTLKDHLDDLPRDKSIAVICGSGYRSSIAVSILEASGFQQLQNIMGGMGVYSESNCPDLEPANLVFHS